MCGALPLLAVAAVEDRLGVIAFVGVASLATFVDVAFEAGRMPNCSVWEAIVDETAGITNTNAVADRLCNVPILLVHHSS